MKVKIDTKEKMHVITPLDERLAANMTEELQKNFLKWLDEPVSNVIVNFENVIEIDSSIAETLLNIQHVYYEKNHSMVFCKFKPEVEKFLDENEVLEIMNVTPTESEAWDIVQMEEIERELL